MATTEPREVADARRRLWLAWTDPGWPGEGTEEGDTLDRIAAAALAAVWGGRGDAGPLLEALDPLDNARTAAFVSLLPDGEQPPWRDGLADWDAVARIEEHEAWLAEFNDLADDRFPGRVFVTAASPIEEHEQLCEAMYGAGREITDRHLRAAGVDPEALLGPACLGARRR